MKKIDYENWERRELFEFFSNVSQPFYSVTFIGALLFFVSDSTLFYVRFNKDSPFKTHFVPMLTYIIAEFLIVYGFILHAAM